MTFVIRSMSTTDARPGQKITPYHVYLKSNFIGFTRSPADAARFPTEADALMVVAAKRVTGAQVAPIDAEARGLPAYWER